MHESDQNTIAISRGRYRLVILQHSTVLPLEATHSIDLGQRHNDHDLTRLLPCSGCLRAILVLDRRRGVGHSIRLQAGLAFDGLVSDASDQLTRFGLTGPETGCVATYKVETCEASLSAFQMFGRNGPNF